LGDYTVRVIRRQQQYRVVDLPLADNPVKYTVEFACRTMVQFGMIIVLLIAGPAAILLLVYLTIRLIPRQTKSVDEIEETNW